ncbi:MAG: NADH-quinone oxidoreductase subunit H [Candidatus Wallbacteria bacterium]|nr:NADH-quinone oxidoreductase subunit H [Candidatus Wallbacteria bacterium]
MTLLNLLIIFVFPLLFIGIINCEKAWWAGRIGPRLLQPYHDFIRLLKKGTVISTTSSQIFGIAPALNLGAVILAGLLLPLVNKKSLLSFEGDFIVFAYLLALAKFASILSAMDVGSSFEGMGASRRITFSAFVEPAFLMILATLATTSGCTSFSRIFDVLRSAPQVQILSIGLCSAAFFIMLLTEGSRVPVDDPNTHLELTMIHEVMILDNSGPDLAYYTLAHAMEMVFISSLIAALILPVYSSILIAFVAFTAILIVLALAIAICEISMARLRMSHIPQYIYFMNSLACILLFAMILILFAGRK